MSGDNPIQHASPSTSDRVTLLFIGGGNMGAALISGALPAMPDARFVVVDPQTERVRALLPAGAQVEIVASTDDLPACRSDLTVLAVKPQQFAGLPHARLSDVTRGAVVSIMAGMPVAGVSSALHTERVARVMPNLAAIVGQSASVGYHAPGALSEAERRTIERLFESVGSFAWMAEEDQIDLATAVAGSGPGYLFAFAEHLTGAAVANGMTPEEADRLVRQTLLGAATLLARDERAAGSLKQAVTSPGGTTQAGLSVIEAPGALPAILRDAVAAAYRRARELSAIA